MVKNNTILVVDDDPYILLSIEFVLKKNGYNVMVARNGTEALDIINTNSLSLVLLDIMMPDVDGFEICSYIKSSESLSKCKVVFISAKSNQTDIEYGIGLGADLYIIKPFSTRDLISKINTLLN
jgi:DNA-binding response OmpR family regulator